MSKKPTRDRQKTNLSQFGLLDFTSLEDGDDDIEGLSDDDMDLEAELAKISSGGGGRPQPKKPAAVPPSNLDAMIAESLKDVPSDEDVSGDEDDPDLLSELKELADDDDDTTAPAPPPRSSRPAPPPPGAEGGANRTVSLLQERINNYMLAEKQAKESGESSRARRFSRGLKNLNDLLKQAKAGKPIKDEDIPPPVALKSDKPVSPSEPTPPVTVPEPSAPEPAFEPASEPVPEPSEDPPSLPEPAHPPPPPPTELDPEKQQGLLFILKRKEEFKAAALSSKHAGDKTLALEYLKVVKQFDVVVEAYKSGQAMDLNELPTPEMIASQFKPQKTEDQTQNSTEPVLPEPPSQSSQDLITAPTVGEALRLRLQAFKEQEAKAKEQGNSSKARRLGRVVKQYEDAIKLHAAGKPIPSDELPVPLGHGPLPSEKSHPSSAPAPPPAPRPAEPTRYNKQLAFLLQRQKVFREAAVKAKKEGNIEEAKEYLRAAKGFDSVIEAAKGGLTVDLKSLPLPPKAKDQLEHTFEVVSSEDVPSQPEPAMSSPASAPISAADDDVMSRLHQQLTNQLKLCLANRDHYRAMGNVAETNRFEHLAVSVKQDLDVVTVAKSVGHTPPKFHYESRQFSIVQCNTDLNENDLELTIVRGIAYNVPNPKDVDTYVKFEFPYPQETPVIDRTSTCKDTNSPEYNAVFPLTINRGARPCLRVFKRHGIKFEVYSKGGWFSRDSLLGTLSVKLAPLENHVTIHEAFPLMDGRRPAGGSLEIKLRVRTPLLQQQVENTTTKWLVIDN